MNIRGIELLRSIGLAAPIKELISRSITEIGVDDLYSGADLGTTIMVFDYYEKINQLPFLEKQVRKYKVSIENFEEIFYDLTKLMLNKGVKKEDLRYVTHQTYSVDNISFSGRVTVNENSLFIDAA